MRIWTTGLLVILAHGGCLGPQHVPYGAGGERDDGSGEQGGDVDGVAESECFSVELDLPRSGAVDLLFVVDNSSSMVEEQAILGEQVALLARELIRPAPSAEGTSPPAVDELHVGVISSDVGAGGHGVATCDEPRAGDAGVLQNAGRLEGCEDRYTAPGCSDVGCPWLAHSRERPDDGSDPSNPPIWEDFRCIASLGSDGCGFEQPLQAALQALTVQAEPGRANEGFLRDDSLLAVVFVSDEDDCSARNGDLFDPARDEYGPMSLRCALNADQLIDLSGFHDDLLSLRGGRGDRLVVAAITGIPVDGSWVPGDPLDALRELASVDPTQTGELPPTCDTANGLAFAPVRFAEVVSRFGDSGVLASICRSDWSAPFQEIARAVQRRLSRACVAAPLQPAQIEACRVVETLSSGRSCPHPALFSGGVRTEGWHHDLGLDEEGRRRCELLPAGVDECSADSCDCLAAEGGSCVGGWSYRPSSAPCGAGEILLTRSELVERSSTVRLECGAECPAQER